MERVMKPLFFISIIMSCILGFYFQHPHPHFIWQKIPVFDAVFGFIGCVVIIVVSKALGKIWLQKEEDYYDD